MKIAHAFVILATAIGCSGARDESRQADIETLQKELAAEKQSSADARSELATAKQVAVMREAAERQHAREVIELTRQHAVDLKTIDKLRKQLTDLQRHLAQAPENQPKPTRRRTEQRPELSGRRWEGGGPKTTEIFSVGQRDWALAWTSNADFLSVMVYRENGDLVSLAANVQGESSDVTSLHSGPGRFYLEINSIGGNWSVGIAGAQ